MKIPLIWITLSFCAVVMGQDPSALGNKFSDILQYTEDKYGVDQQLVNGQYYVYPYAQALGHPFLKENEYSTGNIIIRDTEYKDIQLKYDIFEQVLVINNTLENYDIATLLPIELVSEFGMDGMLFRKITLADSIAKYYQVVSEEEHVACFYYWYKLREESFHNITFSSYRFQSKKPKKFLVIDDQIGQYKSKRSFIKLFPEELRSAISVYLKSQKMNIKSTADQEMKALIRFSNTLLEQEMSH